MSERYRSTAFVRYPLGAGRAAIALGEDVGPMVVASDVALAFETLRAFATADEHERAIRARVLDPARADHACRVLRDVLAGGALLRESDVAASVRPPARAAGETSIRTLAVVTCDRPEALRASLGGFLAHAARAGRSPRVVVGDDSRDPRATAVTRAAVHEVCRAHGAIGVHIDRADKAAYAARLACASGVPEPIVRFALLGDDALSTIGANRNAVLLACDGAPFLAFDDDVQAVSAAPPRRAPGMALASGDATEWRFFPDRRGALDGVSPSDADPWAAHEAWLGRTPSELVAREAPRGPVDVSAASPELLRDLREGTGRVVATLTGIFGDSGMHSAAGLLQGTSDAGRAQLTVDAATYATAMTSREVLRAVARPTLAPTAPFMSTSFALDPRLGAPPFLPVLRNEDGVFGATLARCHPGAYAAHLPVAWLHAAEPGRTYARGRVDGARAVRFSDTVLAFLSANPFDAGAGTFHDRLRCMGARLRMLGEASPRDHRAAIHALALKAASMRALRVQMLLDRHPNGAIFWRRDLVAHLRALEEAATDETYGVAEDLRGGRSVAEAVDLSRALFARLGALFEAWPAIVDAARELGPPTGGGPVSASAVSRPRGD